MFILEIRRKTQGNLPEGYPFSIPAIKSFCSLPLTKPVTFFAGENGAGKSTLLEAAAVNFGFNPEGGSRNFCFATQNTHSGLHQHITLVKGASRPKDGFFLRAESFYNLSTNLDELDAQPAFAPKLIGAYGGKSLHRQSHGESFLALALNRFGPQGLYLLDEPEAALSVQGQLTLLSRIHQLASQGCQFIIATHSPILLGFPDAKFTCLAMKLPLWPTKILTHIV